MPIKLCADPTCPEPAIYRGRCLDHARVTNRATHRNRSIYASKRWKMLRRQVLFEEPLCSGVLGEPCPYRAIAEHVHHIQDIDKGGDPWARANLTGLCASCHSRVTRREQST